MSKKTLEQWEKEIDAGIARGRASIKAGNFTVLDENFLPNLQKEIINEIRAKKNVSSKKIV